MERRKSYDQVLQHQIHIKKEKDFLEKSIKKDDGELNQKQKELIQERLDEKRLIIRNSKNNFIKQNEELKNTRNKKKEV